MPPVDIVFDILKSLLAANPESVFVNSLYQQYCNRGGLSRKQLEGLHSKASKLSTLTPGKLATLEAIIKKKPTRERAAATKSPEVETKDVRILNILQNILQKYPAHKRILFLHSKYKNNESITPLEIEEIQKFSKILLK